MTILEKIKFEEDWLSEVNLTKENVKIAFAGIRATALESQRWIPVSERLPEKTDYYIIQYSREVCPDEMAVAFYSVEEAEVDSNYTWEFKPIADCKDVIAWQPLPQPYKAESEG